MLMERGREHRKRSVPRPYTYVGEHPTKMSVLGFMGYLKGKSALLIFQKWEYEIRIPKPRVLV